MDREVLEQYQAQGALQQQAIAGQTSFQQPQIYEQVQQQQAVLVEQTNPSKIVDEIILRLRGIRRLPDGSEQQVTDAKMNKKGIESVWFILDSNINQNIILSHLEEHEIANIMDALQEDIVDDISLNWRQYGIVNKTDLDLINNTILVNIFAALKRAQGQNEKNWLSKISVENISSSPSLPKASKGGFWNKFSLK